MRSFLGLWLSAALPGLLWASPLFLEHHNSTICKPAPHWEASKLGGLRERLQRSNMTGVSFLIVNEQEAQSRAMYWELKRRAPPDVPVLQQSPLQEDVWAALNGDKDDFLVYDRCGRLTFHIVMPYSFLHYPYVEAAVRATYQKDICNCTKDFLSIMSSRGNNSQSNDTASSAERRGFGENYNSTNPSTAGTTVPTSLNSSAPSADVPHTVSEPILGEGGNAPHLHHHHHHHHPHHHHEQHTQHHGSHSDMHKVLT